MDTPIRSEDKDSPDAMTAVVNVLVIGSVDTSSERVESTISLVRDGSTTMVIDPGMVHDRRQILEPLEALAVDPNDVTDIVFSHHHPDHTLNAALFPNARVHSSRSRRPRQWADCRQCNLSRRRESALRRQLALSGLIPPACRPHD